LDATMQVMAELESVWTDITSDVLTELSTAAPTCKRGFSSNRYDDVLADTGTFTFWVNNSDGEYDPELVTATAGWDIGTKIEVRFTCEEKQYKRFYGAIVNMQPDDITENIGFIKVTTLGWLRNLYNYPMKNVEIQVNKTGDEALTLIVAGITEQPLAINYDVGTNEFEAVFDTVLPTTKGATEANKIALSEGGYIYTQNHWHDGEILRFENANARNGLRELKTRPQDIATAGYIQDETGENILDEEGNPIGAEVQEDVTLNGTNFESMERDRGANILNKVKVTAYPKSSDDSVQVLYSLGKPLKIAPGQTKTIVGNYTKPGTEEKITVYDSLMEDPVATTDYLMNRLRNGTGTDLTADLTVTRVYEADKFTDTLVNNSVYTGYVTLLQARGYGVYMGDTLSVEVEDIPSQTAYGVKELVINQLYQTDVEQGTMEANKILFLEKDPRNRYNKINMKANKNAANMYSFLTVDIGDLVHIENSVTGLDSDFYVQGISWTVSSGNIIDFSWLIKEAFTEQSSNLTPVNIEFAGGNGIALDYGSNFPSITNPDTITIIFTINVASLLDSQLNNIICKLSSLDSVNVSGWQIWADYINSRVIFRDAITDYNTIYYSPNNSISLSTEIRFAISCSNLNSTTAYSGVWYKDGSAIVTVKNILANIGVGTLDIGNTLTFGGASLYDDVTYYQSFDGIISNVKIYDVELTADEIALDYAGTKITRGLVLESPYIKTSEIAHYTDLTMTSSDKVIDNVHGVIGTPSGSPICRIP